MAVTAQKLDIKIGHLVEIAGRRYDVVSDGEGGVTLEPAITKTVAEMRAEHGELAVSRDEWVQRFVAPLPPDGEG